MRVKVRNSTHPNPSLKREGLNNLCLGKLAQLTPTPLLKERG